MKLCQKTFEKAGLWPSSNKKKWNKKNNEKESVLAG